MTDPVDPPAADAGPTRASIAVEVRYAETDAMGIVHHANYLVWFELARTTLFRETGRTYAEVERAGYRLTVTGAQVRYRRPARYGDHVEVISWLDKAGSRGIRIGYEVRRDDELLARGHTEHVWIGDDGRPCRAPEDLRPAFARMAGA